MNVFQTVPEIKTIHQDNKILNTVFTYYKYKKTTYFTQFSINKTKNKTNKFTKKKKKNLERRKNMQIILLF